MTEEFNPVEDKLKFQPQPELEAEVKDKIAEVMQGRTSRPIISVQDAIKFLRKKFGAKFSAMLCGVNERNLAAFARSTKPKPPTPLEMRNIAAAYLIADILTASVSDNEAVNWLTSYSAYLWGIPAIEMGRRPEDVRIAALNFVSNGEEESVI